MIWVLLKNWGNLLVIILCLQGKSDLLSSYGLATRSQAFQRYSRLCRTVQRTFLYIKSSKNTGRCAEEQQKSDYLPFWDKSVVAPNWESLQNHVICSFSTNNQSILGFQCAGRVFKEPLRWSRKEGWEWIKMSLRWELNPALEHSQQTLNIPCLLGW
jgi:hypothetical protein